ncbi:DUF262 domain-containing protein [Paeniglutamicibacter sp. MACA_103]|uniref:DUF262 domain-containing protein n=1 Tax=Paeniglutamicibacter sp. MACA_103 TaxID=3377337 RepID=UPI003893B1CA
MKAESQSLKRIFQGSVRYEVPLYQRPYVWQHREEDPENDRIGPFWDDVKQTVDRLVDHRRLEQQAGDPSKVAPMTPHFFGAVVIGEPSTGKGGVVAQEVIDGQQRLTTSQLLLSAATAVCATWDKPKHASRLRKLWTQDDDVEVDEEDVFKLRPTRHDRDVFTETMQANEHESESQALVWKAREFFERSLQDWASELPADRLDEYFDGLRDTLYEQLLFVVIELQPGDNPQGIFESLNAQGERLLAIDLVKNHVFRSAKTFGLDLDKLDREVWQATFGEPWWREKTKQGRYLRPRAELFLMHWLTERTNSEISATGLFVEFSRLFGNHADSKEGVKAFIDDLVSDAGIYRNFHDLEEGTRERLFFSRREVLDIGVIYPVALRVWRSVQQGQISQIRLHDALAALESWLVRRMTLRLTTKNYNRIMLELLKSTDGAADPVGSIIGHLKSFDEDTASGWWPTDEAFRYHLLNRDLYKWLPQARVRMLLKAVEAGLFSSKTEKLVLPSRLSIEHIIPQTWMKTWPLPSPSSAEAEDSRKTHLHRIGNLTLVTSNLNPALGNDPWEFKRKELAKHSALRLNAHLVSDHPLVFDESTIDERSSSMADLIISEWPGPQASE